MAIYTSDDIYALRLTDYLKKRKGIGFEILTFTNIDSFQEYIKHHKIEILLMERDLSEEIPKDHIRYLYKLTELPWEDDISSEQKIFKYQSAQKILSEVISDYTKRENQSGRIFDNNHKKVITLISSIPDRNKAAFAWAFAYLLSERRKVLFIPMELFPLPILSIIDDTNQSLSQLIYYLKESNPQIIVKMNPLLNYMDRLSYLSGLSSGLDLLSITQEDIKQWLQELRDNTDYQVIIFYFSFFSEAVMEVLRQSDNVIMISSQSDDQDVLKEWNRQLQFIGLSMPMEKLQQLFISKGEGIYKSSLTLQELQSSNLWNYAIESIRKLT
jgi:hypothetical protein